MLSKHVSFEETSHNFYRVITDTNKNTLLAANCGVPYDAVLTPEISKEIGLNDVWHLIVHIPHIDPNGWSVQYVFNITEQIYIKARFSKGLTWQSWKQIWPAVYS